jgi:uroporphyrinogen-III synthase
MRLLVTRPEPDASDLAARLRAQGHTVLVAPLTQIVFATEPVGVATPAAIAVTSRNGVRALASWQGAKAWSDVTVYAVGAATAAAAREAGCPAVRSAAGDAAALAALIRHDFDAAAGSILYAAARDRTVDLAAALPGVSVTTVEAYAAEAVSRLDSNVIEAVRAGAIDGVLLFSRRTAEIFSELTLAAGVQAMLARTTLYALSSQVAQPLARLRPARILVASQPNEAGLLALVNPALAQFS